MSIFVAYRSASIRLTTGPRLHYAEFGKPDGPAVLFLHGWPDSWFSFSRVLRLLPEDLRAIAIDQRGFGESDRPESGYSIPELADDAIAFLDALDIPRATLVGHSFGSFVARRAAIAHPDRVAALARQLARMGARIEERPDGLVIEGGARLRGAEVESGGEARVLTAPVVYEVSVGLLLRRSRAQASSFRALAARFPVLPFDHACAVRAAEVRAELARR